MGLRTKKNLGQHFLLNPVTIGQIVQKAGIGENDLVLEIGAGSGALTRQLASQANRVIAIEKDRRFVELLKKEIGSSANLEIIEADILEIDLEEILKEKNKSPQKWKVVANLPYNVATEVIFFLLRSRGLFQSFHLMVQKEVALRLAAKPGVKDYGILSIMSQIYSENRIVMTLPPGAFTPPPKVSSAVVEFEVSQNPRWEIRDFPLFEKIVRLSFNQRRKMLRNSLKSGLSEIPWKTVEEALHKVGISPTSRPEEVPIEKFVQLVDQIFRLQETPQPLIYK